MATIKAIERRSVHQIQSGQVIVDLVSVVKELLENSLDAGASSIDIRFKNHGLDAIEVQDNGNGIAPQDFESLALKHYTSKLASFEDLDSLHTFGFRGEALSSLSALSDLRVITARAQDGAVGKSLEFEQSGKLKSTTVVAAQKGTTVVVESLFRNLPVRRKELEKNIKREYGKVLGFLHSYACIGVGLRISVSNQMPKGKKMTAFSTKGNSTTKENIANVYGAKTLAALVRVDLKLTMAPGTTTQTAKDRSTQAPNQERLVTVEGHISKPGWGEGRQAPDRQMLFVNSRPCNLPQVSKVFNEVYKSFNHHQSPFVLANFRMDTHLYDVNVSPDKKTIMLHDQTELLEALKAELTMLFDNIDHTLPQTQPVAQKLPYFKPLSLTRKSSDADSSNRESSRDISNLIENWTCRNSTCRGEQSAKQSDSKSRRSATEASDAASLSTDGASGRNTLPSLSPRPVDAEPTDGSVHHTASSSQDDDSETERLDAELRNTSHALLTEDRHSAALESAVADDEPPEDAEQESSQSLTRAATLHDSMPRQSQSDIPSVFTSTAAPTNGPVIDAFARMRSRRASSESVEITIGHGKALLTTDSWHKRRKLNIIKRPAEASSSAAASLSQFAAPDSQLSLDFGNGESSGHGIGLTSGDSTPELPPTHPVNHSDMLANIPGDDDEEPTSGLNLPTRLPSASTLRSEEIDEVSKKAREDEDVARLIQQAEQTMRRGSSGRSRVFSTQSSRVRKDAAFGVAARLTISAAQFRQTFNHSAGTVRATKPRDPAASLDGDGTNIDAESKLSLTVSKTDFDRMIVVGQFNLGFILAARKGSGDVQRDELFIIDQHAADEKYNYERLQSTVVLQSQRLVRPIDLELSAVEQEVVVNHMDALKANGFEIDTSLTDDADSSVQSFKLLTLPMTNHKTFHLSDLEELLHLLSEVPSGSSEIPRPRKVQRILAMRACRSSIMVGKTLTTKQMSTVVRHMGGMDKPWNCPHGRPTMRHLYGLDRWQGWHEWQAESENTTDDKSSDMTDVSALKQWVQEQG